MEYSSRGQHSLYPLDAVLGLPARSYSYEIQRRLVKAAVKGPFDEAIEELADALGVNLSKRSEEHTSELQSRLHLVCRLLLEKKKNTQLPYSARDYNDGMHENSVPATSCSTRHIS